MPGTTVRPRGRARSAAAHPSVVSWSVRATTSRPARRAVSMRVAGSSVPSDTEEWACRSIRIAAQTAVPARRRTRAERRGRRRSRLGQPRDGLGVVPPGAAGRGGGGGSGGSGAGSSLPSSSPVVAAALSLPNSSSLTCRYRVWASGM